MIEKSLPFSQSIQDFSTSKTPFFSPSVSTHFNFQPLPCDGTQTIDSSTDFFVAQALNTHADPCFVFSGCTLFFYESDGRSGIDHNSIPKHAVWVENSIVQAVPEHPKKDFVFCLSNSLGDAFLFQVCWALPLWAFQTSKPDIFLSSLWYPTLFSFSSAFLSSAHYRNKKMIHDKINICIELRNERSHPEGSMGSLRKDVS